MKRILILLIAALALALAGCGEKSEPGGDARSGKSDPLRLVLDYFPNADHAGIYAAQASGEYDRAGLDVEIKPPPDPSAPLKLLRAGRADVVLSYEPELLLARSKGADDLVAIGALVQKPLTSLMALPASKIKSAKDLAGKRVGTAGIGYQSAYLKTILDKAGVDPGSVKETNVGFDFTRPLISKRVDATLGAFWNYEGVDLQRRGKKPVILKMDQLGVPAYNELVFVARREDFDENGSSRLRRFLQATARGHRALREDPSVRRRRAAGGRLGPGPRAADGRREGDAAGVLPRGRGPHVRLDGPRPVAGLRGLDGAERADQAAAVRGAGSDQRVPAGRGAGSRRLGAGVGIIPRAQP